MAGRTTFARDGRGFTLVEAAIVLGIVAVVTALGAEALSAIRARSARADAANDLLTRLRHLRQEAFGRGAPTVFVLDRTTGRYWGLVDANGDFSIDTFDPAQPAPAPDRLVGSWSLGSALRVGPDDGHGTPLPAPYAWIPATSACSLCDEELAWVVFHDDGRARPGGARPEGGAFTVHAEGGLRSTFAIVALTGAIERFER